MSKSDKQRRNRALSTIHRYAGLAGIDREDRLIIACRMLDTINEWEVESYADLTTEELEEMATAFKGWFNVQLARWGTGVILQEARKIVERADSGDAVPDDELEYGTLL